MDSLLLALSILLTNLQFFNLELQVPCVKVGCSTGEFSSYFRMFRTVHTEHWALDPQSLSNVGDLVVIRLNDKNNDNSIAEYVISKVVFQHGNVIDPVTKKRVFGKSYEDEVNFKFV